MRELLWKMGKICSHLENKTFFFLFRRHTAHEIWRQMQTSKLQSPYNKIATELLKKGECSIWAEAICLCYRAFLPLETIIMGLAFLLLDFYTKLSLRKTEVIQNKAKLTCTTIYSLDCGHRVIFPLLFSISAVAFGGNSVICGSGLLTPWLVIKKSFINNRIYYVGAIFFRGDR